MAEFNTVTKIQIETKVATGETLLLEVLNPEPSPGMISLDYDVPKDPDHPGFGVPQITLQVNAFKQGADLYTMTRVATETDPTLVPKVEQLRTILALIEDVETDAQDLDWIAVEQLCQEARGTLNKAVSAAEKYVNDGVGL